MKRLRAGAALVVLSVLASCDAATGPRTGALRLSLLTESGAAALVQPRVSTDPTVTPDLHATSSSQVIAVDEVRVRLDGPTARDFSSAAPAGGLASISVRDLAPGTYSATLLGMVNGQVAHFGELGSIVVEAGTERTASVALAALQPVVPNVGAVDTVQVLRFTVSYGAVPLARSYRVEWALDPAFSNAFATETGGTSTEITVPAEGAWFVRVRALNPSLPAPALASPSKAVYFFQGISTVAVTPATPSIAAGATQQLTAVARDPDNAVVANVNFVWASSNTAVATVSASGLVTGVNGGSVTITALGKGTPGSATVTVSPRPAATLAFVAPPTNTAAGAAIAPIRVAVQDATGQTVTGDNSTQVTLAIGSNAAGNGAITGLATVSAVAGVATFNNLSIAQAGTGYTLVASSGALTAATSENFDVLPGAATQLAFTVAPSTTAANAVISPAVQVTVRDALGNRVTSSTAAITLAIGTNPASGTLAGTRTVNAVSGVASFSGLSINIGGTGYTLTAAASGLTGATSAAFDVTAALPPSQLAFSIQPASGVAGDPLSPAIQVEVRNANGERITTAGTQVTLAFAANPGSGTLTGTKTVNAINGIASFTGLTINKAAAGYTLSAAATGLTGATSSTFTIAPGAATRLRFVNTLANAKGNVAHPSTVAVAITDDFDNTVTSATSTVTLSIGSNPWRSLVTGGGATLSATSLSVAAVAGVATFANVRIDKPGVGYALAAAATGVTAAASNAFNVNVTFDGAMNAGFGAHTCAVSTESGTYCWGLNNTDQLGFVTTSTVGDSIPGLVRGGLTFTQVTTGGNHSCGLTAAGVAYCWGFNSSGQLGNGNNTQQNQPVPVSGSLTFTTIVTGSSHTCGITTTSGTAATDRQVYCWGTGSSGQLGDGLSTASNVPVRVAEPLQTVRAVSLAAGASHTCAIGTNALAYCWGLNNTGQLGIADLDVTNRSVPVQVHAAGTYTWTSLSAGSNHTCGISSNGGNIARCWGRNVFGTIGDNSTTQRYLPTTVAGNLTNWTQITAGANFSCATSATVGTQCWGRNSSGELGNDDAAATSLIPSPVAGGLAFTSIEAGGFHTCGRTGTGATSALYCWGTNQNGRLGSTGVNQIKRAPALVVQ